MTDRFTFAERQKIKPEFPSYISFPFYVEETKPRPLNAATSFSSFGYACVCASVSLQFCNGFYIWIF